MRRRLPRSLPPAYEESHPFQAPLPLTGMHASKKQKNSHYVAPSLLFTTQHKQHPPATSLPNSISTKRGSSVSFKALTSVRVTNITADITALRTAEGLLESGWGRGEAQDIFTCDTHPPKQFIQVDLFPSPCSHLTGENSYEACNWHQAGVISPPYAHSLRLY